MNNPLVSIVTPCYNGEDYVGRFLDSVLKQSYDNIELYFVDDGSTDNTGKVIESFIPKFKKKKSLYITFIRKIRDRLQL